MKQIKRIMMVLFIIIILPSLNVMAAEASYNKTILKITEISHEKLESNTEYEFVVTVKNVGNIYGKNASLSLQVPDDVPLTVKNQILYQNVAYFNPNAELDLTYDIVIDSGAEPGFYTLSIEGTFYDSGSESYDYSEDFIIEIAKSNNDVQLDISVIEESAIIAGRENDVKVVLNNSSNGDAWAVNLEVVNASEVYAVLEESQYISVISGSGEAEFLFNLYVDEDTVGYTPIEFEVTYYTGIGEMTETLTTYLNVIEEDSGEVVIAEITKSKTTIYPEGRVTFDVVVENTSEVDVDNIKVSVSQDTGLVPVSQSVVMINELKSGTSETVSFTLEATDSAESENYPVEFIVSYDDESISQYSGINISNDDDEDVTTPRIIITDFSISKEKIFLGDTFDMVFSVKNTSSLKNVRNLKVILDTSSSDGSDSTFLPLNQSNSFFVNQLGMNETADITIPIKVFANAEGKSYSMIISFEYEDYDGNLYTDEETISIPVYEKTELTVSDVSVGSTLDNGYTLEVDFYNTGKVDITNMMVDIEGDFISSNSNYYVGDFTTGRTDVYDVEIMGSMPDLIEGTVIFTYDDTFGEEEIYEKTFTINNETTTDNGGRGDFSDMDDATREAMFAEGGGLQRADNASEETNNMTLYLIIGGVIVLVAVSTAVVIRKKRKAD